MPLCLIYSIFQHPRQLIGILWLNWKLTPWVTWLIKTGSILAIYAGWGAIGVVNKITVKSFLYVRFLRQISILNKTSFHLNITFPSTILMHIRPQPPLLGCMINAHIIPEEVQKMTPMISYVVILCPSSIYFHVSHTNSKSLTHKTLSA